MDTLKLSSFVKTERFSAIQGKLRFFILLFGLAIGIIQFVHPISNWGWMIERIHAAESDANSVTTSALVAFGAARAIMRQYH